MRSEHRKPSSSRPAPGRRADDRRRPEQPPERGGSDGRPIESKASARAPPAPITPCRGSRPVRETANRPGLPHGNPVVRTARDRLRLGPAADRKQHHARPRRRTASATANGSVRCRIRWRAAGFPVRLRTSWRASAIRCRSPGRRGHRPAGAAARMNAMILRRRAHRRVWLDAARAASANCPRLRTASGRLAARR